LQWHSHI